MWAPNMGNEYGQVIMTVLTESDSQGLERMINGVCYRYKLKLCLHQECCMFTGNAVDLAILKTTFQAGLTCYSNTYRTHHYINKEATLRFFIMR